MKFRKARLIPLIVVLSCGALVPLTGCGKPDDGLSDEQVKKADRLTEIAKKADGNWDNVPQADRDYVLKTFAAGNEGQAKMLILAKAGKLHGGAGGAPGGPPGGTPGQ
jgi:hypothetical protein